MAAGQAFAVAVGLVFLILGGLYVIVRSEQAAQHQREHPDLPQSKVWLLTHRAMTIFFVGISLSVGTWLLTHGRPNVLFAAGVATLCYANAVSQAFGLNAVTLRVKWSVYALGGSLCAVGSALHGGPVGILGATLALLMSAFWFWMAKIIWRV